MSETITVCILAHNKGKSISTTLDSLLDQTYPSLKVTVCANGCTDNTTEIIQSYSVRYANVSLIELDAAGKPNAWNISRQNCNTRFIFFSDGDVYAERNAIEEMYKILSEGVYCAVCARNVAVLKGRSLITRLTTTPTWPQYSLYGRFYGFDNKRMQKALELKGFGSMPKGIIADDLWLTLILDKDWAAVQKCGSILCTLRVV